MDRLKKENLYAIILAGGAGTRFWPMSRAKMPKQFLNIIGPKTFLQMTLARIQSKISPKNIFIVTSAMYARQIKSQIAAFKIPSSNILFEPEGKNTAPAICWATAHIHKINPRAIEVILPSDHLIKDEKKFLKILDQGFHWASRQYLVTLGIVPLRPETGYGYLKTEKIKSVPGGIFAVKKFTEKPSLLKAKQFLRSKNYLWNSGMFVWESRTILEEFKKYLPSMYQSLSTAPGGLRLKKIWKNVQSISIDYGILEKAHHVVAIPADIGWSDLGSWEALKEILPSDQNRNVLKGDVLALDCANTMIFADRRLIASVGLKNLMIIDTPDVLLVCPKDRSQDVKAIVTKLKMKNRPEV